MASEYWDPYCDYHGKIDDSSLIEWGKEAIDPLIARIDDSIIFASKALAKLTKELVKTDKEKENILRFLGSEDPAMVMMGASMLKGILEE